jgi:hypothetical protein
MADVSDLCALTTQLAWHCLNVGNVQSALDAYDLRQKLPDTSSPSPVPVPLLRALLTAASMTGLDSRAEELFTVLKLRKAST